MSELRVEDLEAGYGAAAPVFSGLSFAVKGGEVVALLGPNGVGKSTLLKSLAGLQDTRAGDVKLDGVSIAGQQPERRLRSGIALVPEGRRLFSSLTVADNLRAGTLVTGNDDVGRAVEMFPRLGERMRQSAGSLSGGEQQMLAVARAMLSDPEILLIDEPSLGLAPLLARDVIEALRQLADAGKGILLAEQNLRLALPVADRAIVLADGKARYWGPCKSLEEQEAVAHAYREVTQLDTSAA